MDTNSEDIPPTGDNVLLNENSALRGKLKAYEKLEKDLMADEVFEKAKKRFISWLTAGGLAVLIAAVLGVKGIQGYIENLAKQFAEEQINKYSEDTLDKKVNDIVDSRVKATVEDLMKKKEANINELILVAVTNKVSNSPIGNIQHEALPRLGQTIDTTRSVVDLSEYMSPVRNQGSEGSTIGFSVTAAMEGLWAQKNNNRIILSPRYIYNSARAIIKYKGDVGAFVKDGVQVLFKQGAILESAWPYKSGEFASKPPSSVEHAERFRPKAVREVKSLDEIKAALQRGYPVVAAITIFKSYTTESKGVIPDPTPGERVIGGHSICIVGYDDSKNLLKFKNSWGERWGDAGYGYLSYSYAKSSLNDIWVLEL